MPLKRIENISSKILDEIDIYIALNGLSQKEALLDILSTKRILIVDD